MAVADESQKPQSAHFDIVLRGYNQRQVNERVTRLGYDLKNAAKSRDEAMARVAELSKALNYAQQELTDTKRRLERMATNPSSATAMTERVREMMRLAEEEVAELRRDGEELVAKLKAEADKYATETRFNADKYAVTIREDADKYGAKVRAESDAYMTESSAKAGKLESELQAAHDVRS